MRMLASERLWDFEVIAYPDDLKEIWIGPAGHMCDERMGSLMWSNIEGFEFWDGVDAIKCSSLEVGLGLFFVKAR